MITIGIDPHKSSHTAVALDEAGRVLGELRVSANKATLIRLQSWAGNWPERTWAIEGAGGLGHLLAQQLVAAGEAVVDVPAALAARSRLLGRGHGRKTDGIDAHSVASVAQHHPDLRRVVREDHSGVLRLLSDRRDELAAERRRVVNRLHRLLRDLHPGGAPTEFVAIGFVQGDPGRKHLQIENRTDETVKVFKIFEDSGEKRTPYAIIPPRNSFPTGDDCGSAEMIATTSDGTEIAHRGPFEECRLETWVIREAPVT